jgi:hypothetical protein
MISSLEFILFSPGALFDIEFDRSEKTPIKAIKNVLIFGDNASFVLRFCYGFNYYTGGKKFNAVSLAD